MTQTQRNARSRRDAEAAEDRARNGIKHLSGRESEDTQETRRKVLKALAGGIDPPTVAKTLHVSLDQVREWQTEEAAHARS